MAFGELVASANKMNESNVEFTPIKPGCGAYSLCNCWQQQIQPAIPNMHASFTTIHPHQVK